MVSKSPIPCYGIISASFSLVSPLYLRVMFRVRVALTLPKHSSAPCTSLASYFYYRCILQFSLSSFDIGLLTITSQSESTQSVIHRRPNRYQCGVCHRCQAGNSCRRYPPVYLIVPQRERWENPNPTTQIARFRFPLLLSDGSGALSLCLRKLCSWGTSLGYGQGHKL